VGRVRVQGRAGCLLGARAFILKTLEAHDAAKLKDVLANVYRDGVPDPTDITKFEWETVLRFMGSAAAEEIKDVQLRIGRVWMQPGQKDP
jgi:hypothetical protein